MADYKVKSYSSYASSMAKPTSSGMSSKLDSKGYTPKSTSSSSVADRKGYTPVSSSSKATTASAKSYQLKYAEDDKKMPSAGLGAKQQPQQQVSKPTVEDKFANAWINAGGAAYDTYNNRKINPLGLYETPTAKAISDYLTGTAIQDSLYEAQGLINQATTPQMKITTSPMTAEEIKKFAPVKELSEKGITVEQLSSMDAPTQKATLESLGITNAKFVSSSMENMYPMSLQEFDQMVMDSVVRSTPRREMPPVPRPENVDPETGQSIQSMADVVANEVAQGLTPPALDGQPAVDALSNQLLEVPKKAESKGLMAKPTEPTTGLFTDTKTGTALKAAEGYRTSAYSMNYQPVLKGNRKHNSGLTIGAGFDLGHKTAKDLKKFGVPADLIKKLEDSGWLGLNPSNAVKNNDEFRRQGHAVLDAKYKKEKADGTLLSLTPEEIDTLTKAEYDYHEGKLKTAYENNNFGKWDDLSENAKAALTIERYHKGKLGDKWREFFNRAKEDDIKGITELYLYEERGPKILKALGVE